ncbi:MAG: D-isomer specific 2-hydroxyacid dehydrogenase [Candidatus Saccharibacteria bacterium]|nr:D-isomer specific 2-hydroxyacid dehydrogenase [Candidatus Saccharibacteria bacterium]
MNEIAVLDYRFLPDTKAEIQALASNEVLFPWERCPEAERITRTGTADIALVTPWDMIDTTYLDACPQLKYVGLCGTSTANIDLDELDRRGIAFSNIVSGDKESVAEFFFMQLVSLSRGLGEYQWKPGEQHELVGRRIGIIGLGAVGKAMAHMALAYKMDVVYFSPHRKQDWEDKGIAYLEKNELLQTSEIVMLCTPTNVEVLGEAEFTAMKAGSILVQACGGNPFDKPSFYNWIAQDDNFALFDMSASEQNYQAYQDLPRVIFSRSVAGDTYESNERRGKRVVENLHNYLNS